jgi:16S rRNA (cytidine1402-2'-O)-methyltransferase
MSVSPGTLYVVATPIGNLNDLTTRALQTLENVELILAEDTRTTRNMLTRFEDREIRAELIRLDEHTSHHKLLNLVDQILQGANAALVSDAGTPGVSDPGGMLIAECLARHIPIVPIPGPSALTTILSVADFATQPVAFYGFLPKKKGRQTTLKRLATAGGKYGLASVVMYESPMRIVRTLTELAEVLGPTTHVVVGRELTKLHEELWYGTLADAAAHFAKPRGEFTILVQLPAVGRNSMP